MKTSKPDLMAASARAGEGKRILAQLEHGPRAPALAVRAAGWSIDGWTIGLCALLLVMCSVAWLMHDQRITPETFRPSPASGTLHRATQPAKAATLASAPVDAEAAAIINEPGMPHGATTMAGTEGGTAAGMPRHAGAAQVTRPSAATAAAAAAASPKPTATTVAIANAAAAQQAARAATHKPVTAAQRPATAPPPAQASGDTDVTLLTALVAHSGKPSSVAAERSRDVVDRQDGDSSALLLARCKQLGMIEGMLCRSRICSGRWENDAACRAPAN